MIKFFRNIRRSSIMEKRTKNYIAYALGEIILVMVGILLALQVNSWYQQSQDRKLENKLLVELKNSIIGDSMIIHYNLKNFIAIRENSEFLDSVIKNRLPHTKKVDSAFGIISAFNITEANYVIFDRVKSLKSGIITNDSLFVSLSNYYNFSRFLHSVDNYFENGAYFRRSIYPKYFKSYRYGRIAEVADYEEILNSNEIKIAIDYCINDGGFYTGQTRRRKQHARQLIEDITEELKRFQ